MKNKLLFIMFILFLFTSMFVSGIKNCSNISNSVVIENNIFSTGTCFIITKNNIVIDGSGFGITGIGIGSGIDNPSGMDNITIKNFGGITGFKNGIYSYEMIDSKIFNNRIITSGLDGSFGILLEKSSGINMSFNTILSSGRNNHGIFLLTLSNNNLLVNNEVITSGIGSYGIFLFDNSNNNNLINNSIATLGTFDYGIFVHSLSDNNKINFNSIVTSGFNGYGIYLSGTSNNNQITSNNLITSGGISYGIFLNLSSSNNTISYNSVNTLNISSDAIRILGDNNNINSNTLTTYGNGSVGINIFVPSINNIITGNTITTYDSVNNSNAFGIFLSKTKNDEIKLNDIKTHGNRGHGIYLSSTTNTKIISNRITTLQDTSNAILIKDSNFVVINLNILNVSDISSSIITNNSINIQKNLNSEFTNNVVVRNQLITQQNTYSTGIFSGYPTIEIKLGSIKELKEISGSTCFKHKRTGRLYKFVFYAKNESKVVYSQDLGTFGGITRGKTVCNTIQFSIPLNINADLVVFEGQWVKGTPNPIETNLVLKTF